MEKIILGSAFYFQLLSLFITSKYRNTHKLSSTEYIFFKISIQLQILHFFIWLYNCVLNYNEYPIYKNLQMFIVFGTIIFLNLCFFTYINNQNNTNTNNILTYKEVYDKIKDYFCLISIYLISIMSNEMEEKNNLLILKVIFNIILSVVIIDMMYYIIKNKYVVMNIFLVLLYYKTTVLLKIDEKYMVYNIPHLYFNMQNLYFINKLNC